MKLVSQTFSVNVSRQNGGAYLEIEHAEEGFTSGTVPLVTLDVFSNMDQRLDPPVVPTVGHTTPIDEGLHLELFDREHQIALAIVVSLEDDRLKIRLPISELVENDECMYRLYTLHFAPTLMRCDAGGHMLLPLNSGKLISPAGQPELTDRFLIYGEQERWELLPMLPVVSVGEGQTGLAALATRCPEDASVRVWTDGRDCGGVDIGACLRQNWIDPVDKTDREVAFVPLTCEPDLVHATAAVLRRHVLEDLKTPTLRERAEASESVRYLFKAPTIKFRQAVCNRGIGRGHPLDESYGEYLRATTCDEVIEILQAIKQAGVDDVHALAVGFLPNGHDGCYPSHDRFDARIGGREGFCRMVAAGNALGYRINVHDNYNEGYAISPEFDWRWCSRDIYGEPQRRGRWGGGQAYLQWMHALPEDRIEGALQRMKALGISGAGYIDAVGNPLYRNYSPEHGGPRRHHAVGIERMLKAADEVYGGVGCECGFLYAARHCTSVCLPRFHTGGIPMKADWPIARLKGEPAPLYNLALSGIVMSEITFNEENADVQTIRSLLWGMHPRVNGLCKRDLAGGTLFTEGLAGCLRKVVDLCCHEFGELPQQPIRRWVRESGGIERTAFEDGTDIEVDFNRNILKVNGAERFNGYAG